MGSSNKTNLIGDLSQVISLLRDISRQHDPGSMLNAYKAHRKEMIPVDRSLSLSRRDLEFPVYRITRSDLWAQEINPWTERHRLPTFRSGLFGKLLYEGEATIINRLQIAVDDPAAEYFAGMKSLAALPHFDDGVAVNMVVHMRKQENAFDPAEFPEMVLLSGMFGRAMKGLVIASELAVAKQELQDLNGVMSDLSDTVLDQARALKNQTQILEGRVRERTAQLEARGRDLEAAHDDAIYMLAVASEEKDEHTGNHLRRMHALTQSLSRALGHDDAHTRELGRAAILHDVGKLHVPDNILKKPGPLADDERVVMQHHTLAGERILPDRPHFASARKVARSHHENWDGSGYPDGLKRDEIPIEARIVHLADVYDALTSVRPYKAAWSKDEAMAYLKDQSGRMFDPALVDTFLSASN
jgi:HD-GYP domain-containing protein (c-di-GMP phosphodiesterase class II)